MDVGVIAILLFVSLILLLFTGFPVSFSLIGVSIIFTVLFWSYDGLRIIASSTFSTLNNQILIAIPMFILMANLLIYSGIGEQIFDVLYKWLGGLRGGLTVVVILACAIMGAMTGIGGTGVLTIGALAIPEMKKRGYSDEAIYGALPPASALGALIPPSVLLILIGNYGNLSIGSLFFGGMVIGVMMTVAMILFILARSFIKPSIAPGIPKHERVSFREKVLSLRKLLLPAIIIFTVLGSIYSGAATPTESAAIGVMAVLIVSLLNRKLTFQKVKNALESSLRVSVMVYFLVIGGSIFASVVGGLGIIGYLRDTLGNAGVTSVTFVILTMLIIFVLGMLMDGSAIAVITIPIFIPIAITLGIDPLWYGLIAAANMTIGYTTPPFGMNLFYLKGLLKETGLEVKMTDIYKYTFPYVLVQVAILILIIFVPGIILF